MRLISRENMVWVWRDPLHHLRHHIFKTVYGLLHGVDRVVYATYCGHNVTVDDINPRTKIEGMPTCMRCIVAEPIDDVIPTKE